MGNTYRKILLHLVLQPYPKYKTFDELGRLPLKMRGVILFLSNSSPYFEIKKRGSPESQVDAKISLSGYKNLHHQYWSATLYILPFKTHQGTIIFAINEDKFAVRRKYHGSDSPSLIWVRMLLSKYILEKS